MQLLGGISREEFLKQYWQKKPLFINQAIPGYQSPLDAEEFAGLACEEGVESRLLMEKGGDKPWQLRHGPFEESDFTSLPDSHWTFLIQAVDHLIPELACLVDKFDFIPTWRFDDLMISYAQDQGSVGPHIDNYDVFLLQVQGQRHWHIDDKDFSEKDLKIESGLRLLNNFESKQDWVLEPGDILYLPPGVAHHGIAIGDCLSFSFGFRAPTKKELVSAYTNEWDEQNDTAEDEFYTDPGLSLQESAGEIKTDHLQAIREFMLPTITDENKFSSWFGCYITENTGGDIIYDEKELSADEFQTKFKQYGCINRNGQIRFSYIVNDDDIALFIAGNEFNLSNSYLPLVSYICSHHLIDYESVLACCDEVAALDFIFKLQRDGYFFFYE